MQRPNESDRDNDSETVVTSDDATIWAQIRDMMDGAAATADTRWQPEVFDPASGADRASLRALLADARGVEVHDEIEAMIADLLRSRRAGRAADADSIAAERAALLRGCGQDASRYGRWLWQPWSRTLVHLLPPDAFGELRLDRNRLRVSRDEQRALAGRCVAIAGLSVGQAIAVTMAQEGVGAWFRLADPDTLDLSNLNRLRAGVDDLGQSKLTLAARAILAIDPYLRVDGLPAGVCREHPDALLCRDDGRPVDLLIEECDDLPTKVALRQRARALGIPVLMATTEGGLLDIERFDLEPRRPIFHGLAADVDLDALLDGDDDARAAFVLAVLGRSVLSARTAASLVELRHSVTSWPQLASAVALGAAQVTATARRILLGEDVASGRQRIDLSAKTVDPAHAVASAQTTETTETTETAMPSLIPSDDEARATSLDASMLPDAAGWRTLASHCRTALDDDARQALLDAAALAPSGGNAQPWRLRWHGDTLHVYDRPEAPVPGMDRMRASVAMAAGSVAESVAIAASGLGWHADIRVGDGGADGGDATICTVALRPADISADPLLPWLADRCTNRRLHQGGAATGLKPDDVATLRTAAALHGGQIHLAVDDEARAAWGRCAGAADRLRFLHLPWLHELAQEVRWQAGPLVGLDVASLELKPASRAVMPLLLDPEVMAEVAAMGGGAGLREPARDAFAASAAIALLTLPMATMQRSGPRATLLQAGRLLQRVWLQATALGLAVHPWGSALFLRNVYAGGGGATLPPALAADLAALAGDVTALLPADAMPTMLMRLSRCPEPTARARRMRVALATTRL